MTRSELASGSLLFFCLAFLWIVIYYDFMKMERTKKRKYEKPVITKEKGMHFPLEIIHTFNTNSRFCVQCSGCHGCR